MLDIIDDIQEIRKAEKEQIIKALEEARTPNGFEMIRIDKAIEIVKAGVENE